MGLETLRHIGHEWIKLAPVEPTQAQTRQIRLVSIQVHLLFLDFGRII